eukprot:COSAG06_NODE_1309_length_9914_cov_2.941722_8_plen_180_part_00
MPWELIARQTASDASPTSAQPASSWAALGDSSATQNFSILDKLATKYGGGPYTLKMRWPELNSGKGGENVWVQSSLPDATLGRGVKATGYREIDIEYPGCFGEACSGVMAPRVLPTSAASLRTATGGTQWAQARAGTPAPRRSLEPVSRARTATLSTRSSCGSWRRSSGAGAFCSLALS